MARSWQQARKSKKGRKGQHSQPKDETGEIQRKEKRSLALPVISSEDQKAILEEITTVFEEKVGDLHLSHIMYHIKKDNPDLDSSQYEEKLRKSCTEERNQKYKDMDPAELIASLNDDSKIQGFDGLKEFIAIGVNRTITLAKKSKIHLILAEENGNIQQRLSHEAFLGLPVCSFNGLGKLLKEVMHLNHLHCLAFSKCEGSPFNDLVKFIIGKIPPEQEETHGKKQKLSPEEGKEAAESNGEQEEKVILRTNGGENEDINVATSTENICLEKISETNGEKQDNEPIDSNGQHEQVVT